MIVLIHERTSIDLRLAYRNFYHHAIVKKITNYFMIIYSTLSLIIVHILPYFHFMSLNGAKHPCKIQIHTNFSYLHIW